LREVRHRSPGRPRAEVSARISARLTDAGWKLLLRCGPEKFTLDSLAAATHTGKQTIYARFAGKVDLLQAILVDRVDMVSQEMSRLDGSKDAQGAFADLAYRILQSLTRPEVRMLDRLVDWMDANSPGQRGSARRRAIKGRVRAQMCDNLAFAIERWNLVIDDVPGAAGLWLDTVYGHVQMIDGSDSEHLDWADKVARFFLRGVTAS
jgi:AcrR family transcriptional regulator